MEIKKYSTLNQTHASTKVSDKYSFIPTQRVLNVLAYNNWLPSKVQEARTRIDENKGFQKHIVRLRNSAFGTDYAVGECIPEIVLVNSHSGTSAFHLMAGLFRLVCANGLVVGDAWNKFSVRHSGYTDSAVENAVQAICDTLPKVSDSVRKFGTVTLNRDEQLAYAKAAVELRFEDDKWAVEPSELLRPRRYTDSKTPTLWNTYNVVQENLINGCRATTSTGRRRNARAITQIDKNVTINRALWTLAQEMANLKEQHIN